MYFDLSYYYFSYLAVLCFLLDFAYLSNCYCSWNYNNL